MTDVINIPIWFACFQAFHPEYNQKTWAERLKTKPISGFLKEVNIKPRIVKVGRNI